MRTSRSLLESADQTTTAAEASVGSVSNRSMAQLLTVVEPGLGAQATEPAVLSSLAGRWSDAPVTEPAAPGDTDPGGTGAEEALLVTEPFLPEEGTAMTEDGLGGQVVIDEPQPTTAPPTTAPPTSAPASGFVDAGRIGRRSVGHRVGQVRSRGPTSRVVGPATWCGPVAAGPGHALTPILDGMT